MQESIHPCYHHTISTAGFMASSLLWFALPSLSYFLSPGQPDTGADGLACHLSRCGKQERCQSSPLASILLFKINLPWAWRDKHPFCLQGRGPSVTMHSWSGPSDSRKPFFPLLPFLGHRCCSSSWTCSSWGLGETICSHPLGLSFMCRILQSSVFSDSVPT